MKIKLFKKGNLFFSVVASISVLIVALSIAYYFVIYLPSMAKRELQLKEAERQEQKSETEIYSDCDVEAHRKATELLKAKVEIAEENNLTYTQNYRIWKEASEKGLYLKDDYNEYYNSCLRRHGIKY